MLTSPWNQIFIHLAGKLPSPPDLNPPPILLFSPMITTTKSRSSRSKARSANQNPNPQIPPPSKFSSPTIPDIEDFSQLETQQIRSSLLQWYDQNRRNLPWRTQNCSKVSGGGGGGEDEGRAYAVWVSEIMLQQTRVQTVITYYNKWMAKWPTVQHLAAASLEEVNEMWAGLGYYRRARFLLEGAKAIVEGGKFPPTAAALKEVKGIGEYTAGAIASIAFNEAVPVVDGNVVRVITRLKAMSANPKETATVKNIWRLAGQLVDPLRPGDFNQAMMELGATLCSKTSPSCSSCPLSDQCCALLLSRKSRTVKVSDYPTKVVKAKQRHDFAAVCVVEIAEGLDPEVLGESNLKLGYLLVKRPEEGLLAGLWEFPSVLLKEEETAMLTRRKTINKYLKELFNLDLGKNCNVMQREDVGEYIHIFSHIRLRMHVELLILSLKGLSLVKSKEQSAITWKCVDENSIKNMGLTSSVRKVYNMTQEFKQKSLQKSLSQCTKIPTRKRTKRST